MSFELQNVTECTCTNVNPRTELHGEERVRAIDLTFKLAGENTLLDAIAPGLREHHYRNKAADASQETLPDVVIPLPNLRWPQLPVDVRWDQPKVRGYRWIWDWGREAQHVDFTDAVLASLSYSMQEGGSVEVKFTVSYNGEELEDNSRYGELCGMAAMGKVHIQLLAPAELVAVKKGWRSGKTDTPPATDNGAPLLDRDGPSEDDEHQDGDHDGDDTGDQHPVGDFAEGSPEAALLDSVQQEPDPLAPPTARRSRGKRAAAGATLQ